MGDPSFSPEQLAWSPFPSAHTDLAPEPDSLGLLSSSASHTASISLGHIANLKGPS